MVQRSQLTRTERRIEESALWSGIDVRGPDECWPWMRSRRGPGAREKQYGQCRWGRRQQGAHRAVYEATRRKPIPPGRLVRHTCDNPPCCNPSHLLLGSNADNTRDAVERNRIARGERSRSRLTAVAVADIRRRRAAGELRVVLAAEYGLSLPGIISIERGRTWGHVTDPPPGFFPNPPGQENRPHTYKKRRRSVVATDGHPLPTVTSEA